MTVSSVDGCITKTSCGGGTAGSSPGRPAQQGLKRSNHEVFAEFGFEGKISRKGAGLDPGGQAVGDRTDEPVDERLQ